MIEVKNVVKKYGKVEVLKNSSFNINKGEIVGLVGNNDVGKSTVMKSIMTFIKINSGEILIDGKDIYKNREYLLENTSSVIEIAGFYPELTGYEHLKLIRDIRGVSEEAINELIEFIDIGKNLNKRTSTYSLGMKQRLAIAIAILSTKSVLILDEPTNGLDQKSIFRLIKILNKCK
ncbi:ABC transporter ATP-binding protein [Clostridium tarantellae]|uniref:ATP-binding cassette domain-containing protein n=1 Tax=Clostridium tarantellae TaxID=39493 RepID=A0A6I1MUE9_9CLOT|nr:ABC transporter ATP-binding protein [Clostridium tarantellae]MPQ44471.1 ATP-binding cassette domain-containing protein [Clostridium tarantellae]